MNEELLALLARMEELTDEEVSALYDDLVKGFDEADEAKNVGLMEEYHEAITRVRETQSTREEESAASEKRAEELRTAIHATDDSDDAVDEDDPDKAAEDKAAEDKAAEDKAAEDEDKDGVSAPVAASVKPSLAAAGAKVGRSKPARRPDANDTNRARLIAQRPVGSTQTGDEISSREVLANVMTDVINRLGRGDGEQRLVASAQWNYPPERTLSADVPENDRKINAVTSPSAIVASGGVCNPVDVDFSLSMVLSVDDEPLGDALPNFGATRGGLRFTQPPTFSGVGGSATTIWTEATDAAPGTLTKPVQKINCGAEIEVFVDAIPTRLQFGNMMGRFNPEVVAANTDLAMSNGARVRELYRLSRISAASTVVSSGQLLGASRDFLATLDQAAAGYRYRSRLNRGIKMRAVLPDWLKDMVRSDLIREMAHGQDVSDTFTLDDATLDRMLSARGISPVWMLDGPVAGTDSTITYPLQGFGAQVNGVLNDWPTRVRWFLFAEGTFQRLDGGRLDIGVIRDSTLDGTNDYQTFIESFEGIALRGFESLEIVSVVRPNGLSAGTKDTSTY